MMPVALIVGPFPSCINVDQREIFLKYFGATKIIHRPIAKRKHSTSYCNVFFSNEIDCENALKKIHQLKLFDKRLSAKYCDASQTEFRMEAHECKTGDLHKDKIMYNPKLFEKIQKYESLLSSISSKFEVNFPISPKLKYLYPPPTAEVLANIIKTLYAVPKFYTQVLHLMNKMNLPCPFEMKSGEFEMCEEVKIALRILLGVSDDSSNEFNKDNFTRERTSIISDGSLCDSESELESDEELNIRSQKIAKLPKRTLKKRNSINKRPKLELLKLAFADHQGSKRASDAKIIPISEDVFEKSEMNSNKKMKVNLEKANLPSLDKNSSVEIDENVEGFGKLHPPQKSSPLEKTKEKSQFVNDNELIENRIHEKDWPLVPVFKNYIKGAPTCRLYIKNLAKTTTEADLKFIFGRYVTWESQEDVSNFSIRLLKEGRMKGQAFITFSSEKIASQALSEVNGFILKDKPMVIVFGKVKEK